MPTLTERMDALLQAIVDAETTACWKCGGDGRYLVMLCPSRESLAAWRKADYPEGGPGCPGALVQTCEQCKGERVLVPDPAEPRIVGMMLGTVVPELHAMQQEGNLGDLDLALTWAAQYANAFRARALAEIAAQGHTAESMMKGTIDAIRAAREHRERTRPPAEPNAGALTEDEINDLIGEHHGETREPVERDEEAPADPGGPVSNEVSLVQREDPHGLHDA